MTVSKVPLPPEDSFENVTARGMLSNQQSEYGFDFESGDVIYSNTSSFFCDAIAQIASKLSYQQSVGKPFSVSVRDSFAAIRIYPGDSSLLLLKGEPFTISVFGVINKNLGTEQYVYYNNKVSLFTGFVESVTFDGKDYIIALESGLSLLDENLLDEEDISIGVTQGTDFDFTVVSPTEVQSADDIGVTAEIVSDDLEIVFGEAVGRVELDLSSVAGGNEFSSYNFEQTTDNILTSTLGGAITVTVADLAPTSKVVTLGFPNGVDVLKWTMRQIYGTVTAYSVAPDRIRLVSTGDLVTGFPNSTEGLPAENSVIEWDNLAGATSITFTINSTRPNGYMIPDGAVGRNRVYIEGLKMWPESVTEPDVLPANISFSPPADKEIGGVYTWDPLDATTITLSSDMTSPNELTPTGNEVVFGNGTDEIKVTFLYADQSGITPRPKVARVLGYGVINNYPLKPLGGDEYDKGNLVGAPVRDDGIEVTQAADQADFDTKKAAGSKSWLFVAGEPKILLANFDGQPTASSQLLVIGDDFFVYLEAILARVGVELGGIYSELSVKYPSLFYGDQLTARQALDEILFGFDAVNIVRDSKIYIDDRIVPTFSIYDHVIDVSQEIDGKVRIGARRARYKRYDVIYEPNHIIQQDVVKWRTAGKTITRTAGNFIKSEERTIKAPISDSNTAFRVSRKLDKHSLLAYECSFIATNKQWAMEPNQEFNLTNSGLPEGSFVSESITDQTDSKTTIVSGVYYVKNGQLQAINV
jgi:hypothetical protein